MRPTHSCTLGVHRDGFATRLCSLGAALLLISACGGGDSGGGTPVTPLPPPPLPEAVTALSVNPASVALVAGGTSTLTPTAVTSGAAVSMNYTYASSASGVATVSSGGVITAVSAGTATITVTANGSGTGFTASSRQATVPVIVTTPPPALTGLTVSPDSVALLTGGTATLMPAATTGGAGVSVQYTYASSAGAVATVSASGVVTAVSPGSATITVTATGSGSGFTTTERVATAVVTVTTPPPAITALSVTPDTVSLLTGGNATLTPSATTAGAGVSVAYSYVSSATGVATVSASGVVAAVSPGTTTITITAIGSGSGFTTTERQAAATVIVTAPPTVLGIGLGDGQFALIPAGSFQMGTMTGFEREAPVRTVTITQPYALQKTEVTQSQWRQVMTGTGLDNPSVFASCGDTCPVEQVSWMDIQTFLQRLNQQDPGKNYRLPTEAEWEYAARAGTTGTYGGTGVLNDMGWWNGNAGGKTNAVAQKLPNAWGLFDMHGNVWEWVNDWYLETYYSTAPNTDPPGPASGTDRVLRGGSWRSGASAASVSSRPGDTPTRRNDTYGFRLARTP